MVIMMTSFRDYCLEIHWGLHVVKCLALVKAPKWDYLVVKDLALYLEISMDSHSGLMFDYI